MKKNILWILLAVLWVFAANAQLQQPLAKKITSFQFTTLTGGTIIIKAQFDDYADTLNFIFDTGSGGISLDSTTAAYFNLASQKSNIVIKGIAGSKTLNFLYNHTLKLQNLKVENLDFHINNYDVISSANGIKIDGIIGLSFLRRYIVKINYDNNTMEVYEPGLIKYPKRGCLIKPTFSSLPLVKTQVADNIITNADLIFDTGAGLNLLLSENYAKDSTVLHLHKKTFTTQTEGLGGKKTMQITVVNKFNIGGYKFKLVPTYIFNDENEVLNYPKSMGIVGNDILRRFNVIINYPNKEIHLKPNTHFYDEFDYAYTGISLYQINGKIKVEDIIPGSPAYEAGLQVDDMIISIDNIFGNNMQAFKHVLQNIGNTIKIVYLRNGEIASANVNIASILDKK